MLQDFNPSTYSSLVIFIYWTTGMRKPQFQFKTNRKVATTSRRFCNEPHLLHVLFVKVVPGITFTSWSKHHFVVIGKAEQEVHKAFPQQQQRFTSCSSYFCLFAPHGCCSSCNPVRGESHIHHNTNWETATLAARLARILKWLRVKETSKMQTEKT